MSDIIRCKDCRYVVHETTDRYECSRHGEETSRLGYCSWGRPKVQAIKLGDKITVEICESKQAFDGERWYKLKGSLTWISEDELLKIKGGE